MKLKRKIVLQEFENKSKIFLHCKKILFSNFYNSKSVMITGGTTYNFFYKILSKNNSWKNIKFLLSDERLVNKKNSNLSNYNMIYKLFLKKVKILHRPYFFFNKDNYKYENYKSLLNQLEHEIIAKKVNKIDLAFLSSGKDGHIASIFFHGYKLLKKSKNFHVIKKKNENFERISFNLNYIKKIPKIIFVIYGKKKLYLIKKIKNNDYYLKSKMPILRLLHNSNSKIFIFYTKNEKFK